MPLEQIPVYIDRLDQIRRLIRPTQARVQDVVRAGHDGRGRIERDRPEGVHDLGDRRGRVAAQTSTGKRDATRLPVSEPKGQN